MKKINAFFIVLFLMTAPALHAAEEAAPAGTDPAAMEKMKALMAPNENHKIFEDFAGKWNYTGTFQMAPGAPIQEMTGTETISVIYGGRFLKQEITGPWMGQEFEGLGYTGYDNIKKEYVSAWFDNMGTGLMTFSGQFDAAAKTLSQSGENSCPLTGETNRKGRSAWTLNDADHMTYTSYLYDADGREFKAMDLLYTRAPETV